MYLFNDVRESITGRRFGPFPLLHSTKCRPVRVRTGVPCSRKLLAVGEMQKVQRQPRRPRWQGPAVLQWERSATNVGGCPPIRRPKTVLCLARCHMSRICAAWRQVRSWLRGAEIRAIRTGGAKPGSGGNVRLRGTGSASQRSQPAVWDRTGGDAPGMLGLSREAPGP